jgi:CRISPR-associated protein Cst2
MDNIKGILITMLVPMENHIANGGEKLLGNASSIKRRPDERVYISGQMQRHALFSAMERLNEGDLLKAETFISNGDGVTNMIEKDLRADMGGFLHTTKNDYSGRRTAPLTVTPAVALDPSEVGRDLLVRLKNPRIGEKAVGDLEEKKQALATREFSQSDMMHMNFFLDITTLSISKAFEYEKEFHVKTVYFKHTTEEERKRRVRLFIEATRSINDYANQARNAVSGEPQQVLIVIDPKLSRKGSRYFVANDIEKANILNELTERNATFFVGNDIEGDTSVDAAYSKALKTLETSSLFDPCGGDDVIKTFAQAFEGA